MGKGKKARLTPEERLEAALAAAKVLKDNLDSEKKALMDEVKSAIETEISNGEEQLRVDTNIHIACVKQLERTEKKFKSCAKSVLQKKINDSAQERWDLYMKCDKVPDAALIAMVHEYLYRWEIDQTAPYPENCKWRIKSAVQLLEKLQEFIDEPLVYPPHYHDNLMEVKERAREHLQQQIDRTTYYVLREMERTMQTQGLNQLQISMGNECFNLCIWGILPYPKTCYPIPKSQRPALVCDFKEITMNVTEPDTLWDIPHALRLMHLKYDNLSDYSNVYFPIPLPDHLTLGIKAAVIQDWEKRLELENVVAQDRKARKQEIDAIGAVKPNPIRVKDWTLRMFREELQNLNANLDTLRNFKDMPIKTPSQRLREEEELLENDLKSELIPELREAELNLRQYMILGGIYTVQVVSQPPQPMELLNEYVMTTLELPKELKPLPLPEEPVEESISDEDTAEDLYISSRADFKSGSILKSVLDSKAALKSVSKMVSITASKSAVKSGSQVASESRPDMLPRAKSEVMIYLPNVKLRLRQDLLWYQTPMIVVWDEEENMWATDKIEEFTFNEEDQMLVFNMNTFGSFALAVDRHTHIPYVNWEMMPGENNTLKFNLTTPVLTLKFVIKEDVVILMETSKMKPNKLAEIIGQEYSLYEMKKLLLQKGLNIFPEHDTHCYIQDFMPKHRAMEDNLYHCMARLSACYRFMWSPQNHIAGHRLIVLKIQEHSTKATEVYTLNVTPAKASFAKKSEVPQNGDLPPSTTKVGSPHAITSLIKKGEAQNGDQPPPPTTKTSADLNHLIKVEGTFSIQEKIATTSPVLIETVYGFLRKIRVLSFS